MERTDLLRIEQRNLQCFSARDNLSLRDPRERSSHPILTPVSDNGGNPYLLARGTFLLKYDYTISHDQGVRFVDVTADPNRIHRERDIVAGALAASKVVAPFEILCPSLAVRSAMFKFVGWCHYSRRVRSTVICIPLSSGVIVLRAKAYQEGRTILAAEIIGVMLKAPPRPPISEADAYRPRMTSSANILNRSAWTVGVTSRRAVSWITPTPSHTSCRSRRVRSSGRCRGRAEC